MRLLPTEPEFPSPVLSSPDWGGRVTRAEIDLDAIAANTAELKRQAGSTLLTVVVKADGYGHGATEVARAALAHGADRLAVYTVQEGKNLRRDQIEAPILVMGPFQAPEGESAVALGLTLTISSLESAHVLAGVAGSREVPVHVKIDTGLTRAGIPADETLNSLRHLQSLTSLRIEGIYSHFASADEPDKTVAYTQLSTFNDVTRAVAAEGIHIPIRHIANSAACLELPQSHLDMVRCGISTYGYYPSPSVTRTIPLRPALTLVSSVARVREVPAGTGVGYGYEFRATRRSLIALVPIGYGDGLPRGLGLSSGQVIIRGMRAPIVGRVSMDQITVDATDIPNIAQGDTVTLVGRDGDASQTADDLGTQAGTISYDILTGIMPRVPRLYVRDGKVLSTSPNSS